MYYTTMQKEMRQASFIAGLKMFALILSIPIVVAGCSYFAIKDVTSPTQPSEIKQLLETAPVDVAFKANLDEGEKIIIGEAVKEFQFFISAWEKELENGTVKWYDDSQFWKNFDRAEAAFAAVGIIIATHQHEYTPADMTHFDDFGVRALNALAEIKKAKKTGYLRKSVIMVKDFLGLALKVVKLI